MANSCETLSGAFKDSAPMQTVEKIKGILSANGIQTTELWHETKVPYCYALTVSIDGISFSTNGKGLTREYALASAYGELMERLQLGFIGRKATQKDGAYSMNDSQDITIPAAELSAENLALIGKVADHFCKWSGTTLSAEELLKQYADPDGNITATPYFNLENGETAYIPSQMRKGLYASNGCAAGNTLEEAIVQAIGEIVERYYRLRILKDMICVPEIPEDVLKQYETAYEIITYVRNQGYKVFVKDCSLGGKFPVVCVCYIHEKTGKYHTHFGAYPDFETALTRALTETFQGRSVDSFAAYDSFLYRGDEQSFISSLTTELVYGSAKRMPDFFIGDNKLPYNENVGFRGKNNKELLKECVEFFKEQGYPILVRDASCLGFPACQVIIPGYSETAIHRLSGKEDASRYLGHAVATLRSPATATLSDMLGCLMHMRESKTYMPDSKASFLSYAKLMATMSKEEESYLMSASMAYVHYTLGQYAIAAKYIQNMLAFHNCADRELLECIKLYLDLKVAGYPDHQIKALISLFHTRQAAALLNNYIDNKTNPLAEFILRCDLVSCDSCAIKDKCCQKKAQQFIDLINKKTGQLLFADSAALLKSLI